ncbi:MAG: GNAT family N-acetyltransferase [Planctomycetaceae bacterium]|nr:GNAT family N-acetyltransferase [Planctomycetaceae bacterium]
MTFDYRPLAPGDDQAFMDVVGRTFRFAPGYLDVFSRRIGRENLRLLHENGRVVAGLGVYRTGQWFGGRAIPCAAVAAVGVAPESRGTGAAAFQMRALLEELHADGTPLASLFASAQHLYRKVGFEQAGLRCRYELPMSSIGMRDRELPVTQVSLESPAAFLATAETHARATNGHLQRTTGLWERLIEHPDGHQAGFVIGDPGRPEGHLIYRHCVDEHEAGHLMIRDMAALTPAAARRLWTLIADHRSTIPYVSWCGPGVEPLLCLTHECKNVPVKVLRWMTRIVNVPAALAGRGYPEDVSDELHLSVRDELLPSNNGRFVLRVHEGRGETAAGGDGRVSLDVRGLAPLFTGFLPPHTLRTLGYLDGDDASLRQAARIFTGPEPWMPEIF